MKYTISEPCSVRNVDGLYQFDEGEIVPTKEQLAVIVNVLVPRELASKTKPVPTQSKTETTEK